MIVAICTSETLANFQSTTRRYIPHTHTHTHIYMCNSSYPSLWESQILNIYLCLSFRRILQTTNYRPPSQTHIHILPDKLPNTVICFLYSGQYPNVNKYYCVKRVYQTPLTSVASCINNKGGVRGTPPCALGSDWTAGPFVSLISTTAVSWQHPGVTLTCHIRTSNYRLGLALSPPLSWPVENTVPYETGHSAKLMYVHVHQT
jgi:hypothetical protein